MDRFDALFAKYDMDLDATQIQQDVKKILLDKYDTYNQKSIYSQILSFVDITSFSHDLPPSILFLNIAYLNYLNIDS